MSNVITIENTEMQIREYNGQRVVTFEDICRVHGCERKRIAKHFERKRKFFIEGEDYFKMTRKELNDLMSPNSKIVGNPSITAYLFTESGYLMIVKSLDDDTAWKVQRQLVNAYFKVKNEPEQTDISESMEIPEHRIPVRTATTPVPLQTNFYEKYKRRIENLAYKTKFSVSFVYHKVYEYVNETYDIKEAEKLYIEETGRPPKFTMDLFTYFPEMGKVAGDHIQWLLDHCKANTEA